MLSISIFSSAVKSEETAEIGTTNSQEFRFHLQSNVKPAHTNTFEIGGEISMTVLL